MRAGIGNRLGRRRGLPASTGGRGLRAVIGGRGFRAAIGVSLAVGLTAMGPGAGSLSAAQTAPRGPAPASAATPIKHLVVIYGENISFDHYFGTYPNATNADGTPFRAKPGTPQVNNLQSPAPGGGTLLSHNPNGANPQRLASNNPQDVLTCDQGHEYTAEEDAFDNFKMDKFPASTGKATGKSASGRQCSANDVLDYYDGNTATAEWQYAQNFAMSDNSFGTVFGPSTPGALDVTAGSSGDVNAVSGNASSALIPDGKGGQTLYGDTDPYYDDCGNGGQVGLAGQNIGDELNAKGLSWGWFEGGFNPSTSYSGPPTRPGGYNPSATQGKAACANNHPIGSAIGGNGQYGTEKDYIPHHEPFEYYASTANPHHLAPTSLGAVGHDTQSYTNGKPDFNTANHQYDGSVFDQLMGGIDSGQMSPDSLPAVSYLKAPGYEDGHAGYSDPLDEQTFITNEVNSIEKSPDWSSTAVVLAYDDSDGWYDHAFAPVNNPSHTPADTLNGPGQCNSATNPTPLAGENGRCGPGPRLPFLVISPWTRSNFVSHTQTEQSSVVKFIEQNWGLSAIPGSADAISGSIDDMFDFGPGGGHNRPVFLTTSGQVVHGH